MLPRSHNNAIGMLNHILCQSGTSTSKIQDTAMNKIAAPITEKLRPYLDMKTAIKSNILGDTSVKVFTTCPKKEGDCDCSIPLGPTFAPPPRTRAKKRLIFASKGPYTIRKVSSIDASVTVTPVIPLDDPIDLVSLILSTNWMIDLSTIRAVNIRPVSGWYIIAEITVRIWIILNLLDRTGIELMKSRSATNSQILCDQGA
jgi:hypothetical protein